MKKGINMWAFKEPSVKRCFQLAKEAGFEGVEVVIDVDGPISVHSSEQDLMSIRAEADEVGVELYSVASGLGWSYPLTDNDPEVRRKGEAYVQKQIDTAAILGCHTVLVVPGMVTQDVPYDIAYQRAHDALCRLAPYAEKKRVEIGVENVWNKFLLSPMEMVRFIDDIGSPYIKAYFDVGNVVLNGYPEQWIRILNNRIAKVHFKDYRVAGGMGGFVELLSGDVDYKAVMQAFFDVKYDGWVTGELSPYPQYPEQFLKMASQGMDIILGRA